MVSFEHGVYCGAVAAVLYVVADLHPLAFCTAACPRNTEWLMVTNGDNLYDATFMSEVVKRKTADVVTFNYYTRFQRVTGGGNCTAQAQQDY